MVKPGARPPSLSPARWQVAGWPLAHDGQGGSMPRTRQPNAGLTTTRSPSRKPAARASVPTSARRPKISWPSTAGNERERRQRRRHLEQHGRQIAAAEAGGVDGDLGPRRARAAVGSGTSRSDKHDSAPVVERRQLLAERLGQGVAGEREVEDDAAHQWQRSVVDGAQSPALVTTLPLAQQPKPVRQLRPSVASQCGRQSAMPSTVTQSATPTP